jgi:hypothetical protein
VTTVAGRLVTGSVDGIGTNALFNFLSGVSISPGDGVYALIADGFNHLIRRIEISTAAVTTLAGSINPGNTDGIGTNARFSSPYGFTI